MAETLGQQLANQQEQQRQGGLSRTQRVIIAEQDIKAKREFEVLQKQAQDLQSTEFSNLSFEEYTAKYNKLSPQLKQFFASPESIIADRNAKIQSEKVIFQNKISREQEDLNRTLAEKQKYIDESSKKSGDWWDRNRKDYNENIKEFDTEIRKYQETMQYAQAEVGKIDQGASASDVFSYGEDRANYNRRKREDRSSARKEFNKQIQTGSLDADLIKLGFKAGEKPEYAKFQEAVRKFNANVEYLNNLKSWAGKVGYSNISTFAQEKINPDAVAWQKANPTEKLIFDKLGNVIGVESGKLQKTTTITEYNKLASKTPDDFYKEWQQQRITKPIYLDTTSAKVTLPFETRGTINVNAQETKLYPMGTETTSTPESNNIFKKGWEGLKKFVAKTPDINIPIFIGAGGSIKLKDITEAGSKDLEVAISKKNEQMINATPNKAKIDTTFQEEYQTRFEDIYMKKLIYGEIDFATASAEFEKSSTAKNIALKYSNAVTEDTKNFPRLMKWKYGTQLTALQLTKAGVDLIPKNYGELVIEGALIYTGAKALKFVPSAVNLGLTGGFFAYGSYKALSSKSTPSEAGGGLITAVVTGASLGYAGYRWARSPVVKTKVVNVKKLTMYSSGTVGKDINIITNEKELNRVFYGEQKLSQTIQAGRRTIVTSKWRDLMNKYVGTNIKNIYEGIPTQQNAYQKAMKKLLSYGYTKPQATATLRFYAPKITEQWLKSGIINVKDMSAKGRFEFETRKPILMVDEKLGIKTRGGRIIKDIYKIDRKLITVQEQEFMLENKKKISTFLNKRGKSIKLRDIEISQAISKVRATGLKEGFEFLGKKNAMNIYKYPAQYQDLYSLSRETFSIKITPKQKRTMVEIMDNKRILELGKSTLFKSEIDLKTKDGLITIQKGNPKAFPSTIERSAVSDVNKVIKKLESEKIAPRTSPNVVFNDQAITKTVLQENLKSSILTEQIKITKLDNIGKSKVDVLSGLEVGVVGASALKLKQQLKQQLILKLSLKEMQSLKQVSSQLLKTQTQQKTRQLTRTIQALRMQTPNLEIGLISPRLKTPTYSPPKIPLRTLILFGNDKQLKELIKIKIKKSPEFEALLPDFTARAIGLAPKKVKSVKDALREIARLQTGFEIRTGARFKGYSSIDEKNLMKGIMQ